jgi:hypothetical protein
MAYRHWKHKPLRRGTNLKGIKNLLILVKMSCKKHRRKNYTTDRQISPIVSLFAIHCLFNNYEVWSKCSRPNLLLAIILTFTHDTSIPISYWRLLTDLHTVLHRLINIKHTFIGRGVCHLDKIELRAVIKE